jgi:glycosyltransferase involved in cell wall biosynthesis
VIEAVHQLVPSLARHDAVSDHAMEVRSLLASLGLETEVWYDVAHGPAHADGRPYREFTARAGRDRTLLLYQLSTGSPMADFLLARPEARVVNYHNITPDRVFAPWEPVVAETLRGGRAQLRLLAAGTALGIADSSFNERDLRAEGYASTTVSPVLVDLERRCGETDDATFSRLQDERAGGGADWLFVGRVAPQKRQHDVLKAFAAYVRHADPRARLHLVGGSSSDSYLTAIARTAAALGLQRSLRLTGAVPQAALVAHYRSADVFVCLSEHEGFCVPALEAMHLGLPVVAYPAAAVPDTLDGAGLLVSSRSPLSVATAVERVLGDADLRSSLVRRGRARARHFALERSRARFAQALSAVVA